MSEQKTSTLLATIQEAVRALHVVHGENNNFIKLLLRLTSNTVDGELIAGYDKTNDYNTALALGSLVQVIQEIEAQQKAQDAAFLEASSYIATQISNVGDYLSGIGSHLTKSADTMVTSGYPIRRDDFDYDPADSERPQLINALAELKANARNLELLAMRVSRGLRDMSDCETPNYEDADPDV